MSDPMSIMIRGALTQLVTDQHCGFTEAASILAENWPANEDLIRQIAEELAVGPEVASKPAWPKQPYEQWYLDPGPAGQWGAYKRRLASKEWPGLEELDTTTRQIAGLLANPHRLGHKRKGLVMGNVQSGKTANFAGVIARAADAGYRLVIVLSGMHNNLRAQTQTRLEKDILSTADWYRLTTVTTDFQATQNADFLIKKKSLQMAVVKKNSQILGRLVRWLGDIPPAARRNIPILIVDDEADQATPNTEAQKETVSAINQHLRDLWELVGTGSYVAYTATPFANVLINPEDTKDLFPSDFVATLPPGDGYFGAEKVFGLSATADEDQPSSDGLDMVRTIPQEDADALKPPGKKEDREIADPEPPPSLLDALAWFVIATAIRAARGQIDHASMLVHTTHYVDPHFNMQGRIKQTLVAWKRELADGDDARFVQSWERERDRASSERTVELPDWPAVRAGIENVLTDVEVIVDNGSSRDRLNYETDDAKTVVTVGGGTLSRGLTLNGLLVSYFTRTSNAYDTLMQMGRWFGYRPGYEDLPRVWVTEGLDDDYAFLARAEQEMRAVIDAAGRSEYTPAELGIRIRQHPGRLEVTSRNKMFFAQQVQVGYGGTWRQTFIIDGSDPAATTRTIAMVEDLIGDRNLTRVGLNGSRGLVAGMEASEVVRFIDEFPQHADQDVFSVQNRELMKQWINKFASDRCWNLVIMGNSKASGPKQADGSEGPDLGDMVLAGESFRTLNRAPLKQSVPSRLDFKAIASRPDRLADLDPDSLPNPVPTADGEIIALRRRLADGQGLILLYPISSKSVPSRQSADGTSTRIEMPVEHNILGMALVFPDGIGVEESEGDYISVRVNAEVPEEYEEDGPLESEEDE